jgi:2-dehydro-3-deoxygluconokinase
MWVRRDFDLTCLGEPMLEFNLQGQDASGRRLYIEAHGGDASNVAVAAARQGARVAFASAVGDDLAGGSFFDLWRQEGIDAAAVRVDRDNPTGVYFVSHDARGHAFSYLRHGSAASRFRTEDLPLDLIARSTVLFASGVSLAISDGAADAVLAAIAHARATGCHVAIDTNYRPKLWPAARASAIIGQAMRGADIAFPGLEDAQALLGLSDPDAIVDAYLDMGPEVVVLKMGAQGCLAATSRSRTRIPAFPCHAVDATGAGDTFCGSFLAEFTRGRDVTQCAEYAACAAALATTGFGAVQPMPRRAAVLAALGRAAEP